MNYDRILKYILQKKKGKWWIAYPPMPYIPILPETIRAYLHNVFSEKNRKNIGLYIHIPFCASRCYFCGFYSEPICNRETMTDYINCLEKELLSYRVDFRQHLLHSIYLGGGTPTLLDEQNWEKIIKIINKFFKIDKRVQIATEGTPESCTYSKLKLLKELGINRFSIGVQTFDEKILNSLNRRHSVSDIYTAFKNARAVGFKYINADLLFGLPGETEESFLKTLKHTVELRPECISPTFFEFNKYVLFLKKDVKDAYISKDKKEIRAFLRITKFLTSFGYHNIIDGVNHRCFFLNGQIQAYNQTVIPRITRDSIFAIGCHAESYLNYSGERSYQLRCINNATIQEYISGHKKGKIPTFFGRELLEDEITRQYLIYCFIYLLGRINKDYFLSRFKRELMPFLRRDFNKLLRDNKFIETQKDVVFQQKWPYHFANRAEFLIFCLKYLYSPKILKNIEQQYSVISFIKKQWKNLFK